MRAYFDVYNSRRERVCRICGGGIPAGEAGLRLNGIFVSTYGKDTPIHFHRQCMIDEPVISHVMASKK